MSAKTSPTEASLTGVVTIPVGPTPSEIKAAMDVGRQLQAVQPNDAAFTAHLANKRQATAAALKAQPHRTVLVPSGASYGVTKDIAGNLVSNGELAVSVNGLKWSLPRGSRVSLPSTVADLVDFSYWSGREDVSPAKRKMLQAGVCPPRPDSLGDES